MTKKLILIDLDDTLWDTWSNNKKSLYELYTALGWGRYFRSFEDYFETYYYPVNAQLWERYNHQTVTKAELSYQRMYQPLANRYDELKRSSAEIALLEPLGQLVDGDRRYWLQADERFMAFIREKTMLCKGALELMAYLKSKYKVCILSNGFGEVQYSKIEHSGLQPYVDEVILSDEVGCNKPNPLIFVHALNRMGYKVEEAVMIGDSWSSDIRGAARAGIDSIWYNRYQLETPIEEGVAPLYQVQELLDICCYL
ncbi:MAG: YjjG family noncanonical pyrimidine nucleotidase [Porphyromonas sp.]|nr:YjjG family noncanonical pyrimidine nucleotidase [Porphyromonas sp.]